MKAVIIDDEISIVRTLTKIITENHSNIEIVGTAHNIDEGYKALLQLNPDLVFLDIKLPDGNSFEMLRKFHEINFRIIFITGHEEFALQAFKFSAVDYILKPIDKDELADALEKAQKTIPHIEEQLKLQALFHNIEEKRPLKRIILRTTEFIQLVNIDSIIRCEADNNYTFFYLKDGKRILISKTIKEYAELLKSSGFLRVHQSHLLNIAYIDKYVKSEGGYILMKDNTEIPVSQNSKHTLVELLNTMLYH
jgi:two-component system, LytTR family, response regulator